MLAVMRAQQTNGAAGDPCRLEVGGSSSRGVVIVVLGRVGYPRGRPVRFHGTREC